MIILVLGVLVLVLAQMRRTAENEDDDEDDVQSCEQVIEFMAQGTMKQEEASWHDSAGWIRSA